MTIALHWEVETGRSWEITGLAYRTTFQFSERCYLTGISQRVVKIFDVFLSSSDLYMYSSE